METELRYIDILSSADCIRLIISCWIEVSCTCQWRDRVMVRGGGSVRRRCIHSRYWFAINQDSVYQGPMSCLMPHYNSVCWGETASPPTSWIILFPFSLLQPSSFPISIFYSTVNISTSHIAPLGLNKVSSGKEGTAMAANLLLLNIRCLVFHLF